MDRFFRRPWIIVIIIAAVTVFFAAQLLKARMDNNNFRFIPDNDPARLASARTDEVFGSQIVILVGLERRGGTILDAGFLSSLRSFGEAVQTLDHVASVTSVANTDYIGGTADEILTESLVPEGFSGSADEVSVVKDRLLEWDIYRRALGSDDLGSTQIIVALDVRAEDAGSPESVALHKSIKKLALGAGFEDTRIYITGLPVISAVVNDATGADLVFLIPLVVLVVVGVLYLSFRRVGGITLPLLTVLISTVWAIGAMVLFGVKLSIITTVLPVILVAVGSAYGIHIVSHYYDDMAGKPRLDDEEHRRIVYSVLRKVRWPVFLAALTTFAGFSSLCFTAVVPIFEFGLFACIGVAAAFAVSLTLVPALIIIRGPTRSQRTIAATPAGETGIPSDDTASGAIAGFFLAISGHRRMVLATAAVFSALSLFAVSRLVIDNVLIEYFKSDTDIVQSDRFIREEFGGSKSVSVVVRGEAPGDVLRPDVLAAMDGLSTYLGESVPEVGKTMGFTDMIKRINQVFNADESPDGIRPIAEPAAPADDSSFGFGFGSVSEPAIASEEEDPAPAAATPGIGAGEPAAELDALGLAELLSRALAGSGDRNASAAEMVAELRKAVNYKGAAYYEIPVDPARYGKSNPEELKGLIGNYLALLGGNVSGYADDPLEPRSIRMEVMLKTVGQLDTDRAINAIEEYAAERFPKDVEVEIAGTALVEKSLNVLVVGSQLSSVAASLLMVFLILSIFYRSPVAGLIGLAPLAITILINFGVMGALGIKLNIGTAMVASISVGVGIDYTIHFMAAYHREYLRRVDGTDFRRRAFLTSGKAIVFNAASVGAGFAVLMLSRFNILAYLGFLIALTMFTSSFISLTVLPALLDIVKPAFIRRPMPFDATTTDTEESS